MLIELGFSVAAGSYDTSMLVLASSRKYVGQYNIYLAPNYLVSSG